MKRLLLLAALLAAAGARADEPGLRLSLTGGVGTAYDLAGARFEVAGDTFALFLSTGVPLITQHAMQVHDHFDVAAGLRLYSGHADRWFLSMQSMLSLSGDQPVDDNGNPFGSTQLFKSFTVVGGYRGRISQHLTWELGLGLGLAFGAGCEGCQLIPIPDISAGIGYAF